MRKNATRFSPAEMDVTMRPPRRAALPRACLRAVGRTAVVLLTVTGPAVAVAAGPAAASAPTPGAEPVPTLAPAAAAAFRPSDPRLGSPAGLVAGVAHPDVWWTLGTAAGRSRLFALGADGRTRAMFTLTGTAGRTWNALTIVRGTAGAAARLFLTDLREGRNGSLTLHRVNEPATLADAALPVKSYKVQYPDGGHDAGTMLADPREGRIYIITEAASAAAVYALPGALGPQMNNLTRLRTVPFGVRAGSFAPDGRVVLRTAADVRVLAGIRDKVTQVIRTPAQSGTAAFGVDADGRRAVMADRRGARPVFRAVPLPASTKSPAPQAGATVPLAGGGKDGPVRIPADSGPPGGLIGTGALAGLGLLGVLGGVFYLRGRRRG